MLGDALATRFEFGTQAIEDKVGRHVAGHRLSDGLPVVLTVLDPQLKIGAAEAHAVSQVSGTLAGLRSAAILHCIETGRTEGGNLYVLCEGTDAPALKTTLRTSGGMSPDLALAVAYQVASVLKDAAGVGVTHLDLSSAAIHVEPEGGLRVRIAKFGQARLLPSYNPSRKNEPYHGTAEYMAPEVCAGRPGDVSSDLYALGILMYEMVAGKPPFLSSSPSTTIKRQVYEKPLPLHLVKPGMTHMDAYENLVNRLLAKDPKARPADAAEVLTLLAAIRDEAFPGAELVAPSQRDDAVQTVSLIEQELVAAEPEPAVAGVPVSGGTQVFTGLSEALAEAQAKRDGESSAPAPRPGPGESRPTEAFDASFIVAALDKAKAAGAAQVEAVADEAPTDEAPIEDVAAVPDAGATAEEWQGTDAVTGPVPVSVFTPRNRDDRKESRMFWIVAAAVAVLVAIAIGVYLKGQHRDLGDDVEAVTAGEPIEQQAPAPAPAPKPVPRQMTPIVPPPAPAPTVPAVPQEAVAPTPAPVVSPVVVRPVGPTPAEKASAQVERARGELADGRPIDAKQSLEAALEMDAGNPDAKGLLATVEARILAAERAAARAAARAQRPRRAVVSAAPEAKDSAPKPAGPKVDDAARDVKVRDLIKAGRSAYNDGDYKTSIARYNQALQLDPGNALLKKLLAQAKAKVAE